MKRLYGRRVALALGLVSVAATTMGVSRCGTTAGSTVTVTGNTLTIYASAPSAGATPAAVDVLDAESLALSQSGAHIDKFTISFVQLHRKPSDNARKAIKDSSAIAYLGELQPGVSAGTIGITEDQDVLQVSPTDTAIALTQSTPAVSGEPKNYYEAYSTYGRTFGRVVPSSTLEARAQVSLMRSLHVNKLYVADDGTDYGKAIGYAVRQDAASAGIGVVQGASGADAVFFGGVAPAGRLFASLGPGVKLFVPSALAGDTLPTGTYVSQPGFFTRGLPAAAKTQFVNAFQTRYGHAPATQAIFGYEAMAAVLAVLRQAGTQANDRTVVTHDFFALKNRSSVLGRYSIDSNGDPNIGPFAFSRVRDGTLQPFRFVNVTP